MEKEFKSRLVVWEIDIDDAETDREAAEKALEIQRDPNSNATYFTVYCDGKKTEIDLENYDDES